MENKQSIVNELTKNDKIKIVEVEHFRQRGRTIHRLSLIIEQHSYTSDLYSLFN